MNEFGTQSSPDVEPSTGPGLMHIDNVAPAVSLNRPGKRSWSFTNLFGLFGFVAIITPIITIAVPDPNHVNGLMAIMLALFCWPAGIIFLLAFAVMARRKSHFISEESSSLRRARIGFITLAVLLVVAASLWMTVWFKG